MFNVKKSEAKYRLRLSTTIWKNRHAVFTAVVHSPVSSLEHKLAMFLLQEAHWDAGDFATAYRAGYLND